MIIFNQLPVIVDVVPNKIPPLLDCAFEVAAVVTVGDVKLANSEDGFAVGPKII